MDDVVVRRALRREIEEIQRIGIEAYSDFRNEVPAGILNAYFADLCNLREQWDQAEMIVAEINNRLGGSVMFYPDASTEGLGLPNQWAGFRKLAVAPRMRGQRLGRNLVEALRPHGTRQWRGRPWDPHDKLHDGCTTDLQRAWVLPVPIIR
jgi:predicted N-acetyltransferase YhbS